MKISLQQHESFVIRVGLSLWSYTTLDVLTVLQPGAHKTVKKHNNSPRACYVEPFDGVKQRRKLFCRYSDKNQTRSETHQPINKLFC